MFHPARAITYRASRLMRKRFLAPRCRATQAENSPKQTRLPNGSSSQRGHSRTGGIFPALTIIHVWLSESGQGPI
ncbi:hypothetical protein SKAU_G00208720 [Synaphobranchus kaupii]|uniref:Uncharacterized protein n=1 Tax=Synaphobranchus kaupii TaxID=118154 RepID=A0A9Q1F8L0_SYNKA|nr:hypothetical protein SKAU_G00208720 [Synaphobranchus kaupii]